MFAQGGSRVAGLGERDQEAVELARYGDVRARAAGMGQLEDLGARATVALVLAESP